MIANNRITDSKTSRLLSLATAAGPALFDASMTSKPQFVLACPAPDRPGIVHRVSGFLVEQGANISKRRSSDDVGTNRFFMRVQFELDDAATTAAARCTNASRQRRELAMRANFIRRRPCSYADHGVEAGALPERFAVPSRADSCRSTSRRSSATTWTTPARGSYNIPFFHLPVTPETKAGAGSQVARNRRREAD